MTTPPPPPLDPRVWARPPSRAQLARADVPVWTPPEGTAAQERQPTANEPQAEQPATDAATARAALRRAATTGGQVMRRVQALRPTRERIRVARDLLQAGGTAALAQRARGKLRSSPPSRSRAEEPEFSRTVLLPADPWPVTMPLVTVVIPNYNNGGYLEQCLRSLSRQTTSRFEVLVIDSASSDQKSIEALRQLEEHSPVQFRTIRRPERHLLGCNRNRGWQEARGRYVCFLDPDDLLAPTYLEACLFHLERQGYDVVGAGVRYFEGATGAWWDMPLTATLEDALQKCPTSAPALVRRELLAAADGFHDTGLGPNLIFEDWKLWVRVLALGARLRNVPALLLEVRVHAQGQSRDAAVPDMRIQRAAIAAYNADVLEEGALQRSTRRARTRFVSAPEHSGPPSSGRRLETVILLLGSLREAASVAAVRWALEDWRGRGVRIIVVAESAPTNRGLDWPALTGLGLDDVHVLGEMLPAGDWSDFCAFLVDMHGVSQLWRVLHGRPEGFAASVPLLLPNVVVSDLLADDFRQMIVV